MMDSSPTVVASASMTEKETETETELEEIQSPSSSSPILAPLSLLYDLADYYGISHNARANLIGPGACKGCLQNNDRYKCALHGFAMEQLLRKYCDFVCQSHLEQPREEIITECLTDFQRAFLGILWPDHILMYGQFKMHHQNWLKGKTTPVHMNFILKKKFKLGSRYSSKYIRYPCVYHFWGHCSFFIMFDDGQYFLLAHSGDSPARIKTPELAEQFFSKIWVEEIEKDLSIIIDDKKINKKINK